MPFPLTLYLVRLDTASSRWPTVGHYWLSCGEVVALPQLVRGICLIEDPGHPDHVLVAKQCMHYPDPILYRPGLYSPLNSWLGPFTGLHPHWDVGFMARRYGELFGDHQPSTGDLRCPLWSSLDLNVSHSDDTRGEVLLPFMLGQPIAPQEQLINGRRHRYLGFHRIAINAELDKHLPIDLE